MASAIVASAIPAGGAPERRAVADDAEERRARDGADDRQQRPGSPSVLEDGEAEERVEDPEGEEDERRSGEQARDRRVVGRLRIERRREVRLRLVAHEEAERGDHDQNDGGHEQPPPGSTLAAGRRAVERELQRRTADDRPEEHVARTRTSVGAERPSGLPLAAHEQPPCHEPTEERERGDDQRGDPELPDRPAADQIGQLLVGEERDAEHEHEHGLHDGQLDAGAPRGARDAHAAPHARRRQPLDDELPEDAEREEYREQREEPLCDRGPPEEVDAPAERRRVVRRRVRGAELRERPVADVLELVRDCRDRDARDREVDRPPVQLEQVVRVHPGLIGVVIELVRPWRAWRLPARDLPAGVDQQHDQTEAIERHEHERVDEDEPAHDLERRRGRVAAAVLRRGLAIRAPHPQDVLRLVRIGPWMEDVVEVRGDVGRVAGDVHPPVELVQLAHREQRERDPDRGGEEEPG